MQAIQNPELQPGTPAISVSGEHPLACLPSSSISKYGSHDTIYFRGQPATKVYLVMKGKVKILRHESLRVAVDVYRTDDFFGESVLARQPHRMDEAIAIEPTMLMSWSLEEIEENAASHPELAAALIRLVVQRSIELANRIESFATENIERRLTRALIRFAGRFGWEAEDGTVHMEAFTHEFLSQYIGTSREIVSHYMSRLKREGYLQYSRKGISLQQRALIAWQTEQSTAALRPSVIRAN